MIEKRRKAGICLIIAVMFLSTCLRVGASFNNLTPQNPPPILPDPADVSGFEFYAETISVSVAGKYSMIRQSMVTDDSNIFQEIDFNDPAFFDASLFISATNGIEPSVDPLYSTDFLASSQIIGGNSFIGFLYYNKELSNKEIAWKSDRAFKILKETFGMDVILVNFTEHNNTHFFPFMGFYPDWSLYLETLLTDLPDDGYWGAMDMDTIMSESYFKEKFLQTSVFLMDSVETIEEIGNETDLFSEYLGDLYSNTGLGGLNETTDQLLNIGSSLGGIIASLNESLGLSEEMYEEIFQMTLQDVNEIIGSLEDIDEMDMSVVPDRLITFVIEYEGDPQGITETAPGCYMFDLRKAMNYKGEVIQASKKVYLALVGALFSGIDFAVLSGDVKWNTPNYFEFSSYLLERLELLAFYSGQDIDLTMLYDYNFRGAWEARGEVSRFWCNLHEKETSEDEFDFADHLYTVGFEGFPQIPLAVLEGIDNFQFEFNTTGMEPILQVTKNIVSAVADPINRNVDWEIRVKNIGPVPAYGILPNAPPQDFNRELGELVGIEIPSWRDTINNMPEDLVQSLIDYFGYDSVEELTGTEDARVFMMDYESDGIIDAYVPDVTNPLLDVPYNPLVADWMRSAEAVEVTGQNPAILGFWAAFFENPNSIYNPENWRLDPGEELVFTGTSNIAAFDTYQGFQTVNQTTDELFPYLIYGKDANNTNSSMSVGTDNQTWSVDTQNIGEQNLAKIIFQFQNQSVIDPKKTVDLLNFTYSGWNNISLSSAEHTWSIWDWETQQFIDFAWNTNRTTKGNSSGQIATGIGDLVNEAENYTVYLQLTIDAANATRLNIDAINMTYTQRGIRGVDIGPASFIYSSGYGLNRFHHASNHFTAGTNDIPSLLLRSELNDTNCLPGDEIEYILFVSNNGTLDAYNTSLSVLLPGIVSDPGDFTLDGNFMEKNITFIGVGEFRSYSFKFRVPNSLLAAAPTARWDHPADLDPLGYDLNGTGNPVYISAPINYNSTSTSPYVHHLKITTSSNSTAPQVGESIEVTFRVENLGQEDLKGFRLFWLFEINGFHINDTTPIIVGSLPAGDALDFTRVVTKASWAGYFLPAISMMSGNESLLISQDFADPKPLGYLNLTLIKTVDRTQPIISEQIIIRVKLTNSGTIPIGDIYVDDSFGYDQRGYSLVDGSLIHFVEYLDPGESVEFEYSLKAKTQGQFALRPTQVKYFYQLRSIAYSNSIDTKIRQNPWITFLWIVIPVAIAVAIIGIFLYFKRRYDIEELEQKRREELMFGRGLTQKMWEKQVLTQYLDEELGLVKKKRRDDE